MEICFSVATELDGVSKNTSQRWWRSTLTRVRTMLIRIWHNRRVTAGLNGPISPGDDLMEVHSVPDYPGTAMAIPVILDEVPEILNAENV